MTDLSWAGFAMGIIVSLTLWFLLIVLVLWLLP
jgi:hypothetical protein